MALPDSNQFASFVVERDAPREIAAKTPHDWLAAPRQPAAAITIARETMLRHRWLHVATLLYRCLH
jgi:hypothetical protein